MLGKTVRNGHGVISTTNFKQYSGDAYFWCTGLDALFDHARSARARFDQEIVTQPYGLREFRIIDHDGRVLTFGEPVA
jgi:hypothetical protein